MMSRRFELAARFFRPQISFLIALLLLAYLPLASAQELSAQETQSARKLYVAKCAKCHEFYDPHAYNQAEWDKWMQKMKKKSKLKPDQFELSSRYIDANLRTETKPDIKPKP